MIKLIATDMDGTLLDGNGNIPKEFFSTLDKLNKKDIKFAVASGRPYPTLYENFQPISDDLYFICDNGSYIVEPGKKPIIDIIDKKYINKIVQASEKIDGVNLILCGVKNSYHKPLSEELEERVSKYYINRKILSNLNDIDDDIFKVAIYDKYGSKENSFNILNNLFGKDLKVVISGANWLDINNKGINKGYAIKKVQEDFNILYENSMVFGDFYNDIEMLQCAYYSFVMENANDEIKQYGNFIAKKNTENGVIKAIEEYVLKED